MTVTALRLSLWLRVLIVCALYLAFPVGMYECLGLSLDLALLFLCATTCAAVVASMLSPFFVRLRSRAALPDGTKAGERLAIERVQHLAWRANLLPAPKLFSTPGYAFDACMVGSGGRFGIILLDNAYFAEEHPVSELDATIAHEMGHLLTDYTLLNVVFTAARFSFCFANFYLVASFFHDLSVIALMVLAVTIIASFWLTRFGECYISRGAESAADIISVILTGTDALADSLVRPLVSDAQGKLLHQLEGQDLGSLTISGPYDHIIGWRGSIYRTWYLLQSKYPTTAVRVDTIREAYRTLAPHH